MSVKSFINGEIIENLILKNVIISYQYDLNNAIMHIEVNVPVAFTFDKVDRPECSLDG